MSITITGQGNVNTLPDASDPSNTVVNVVYFKKGGESYLALYTPDGRYQVVKNEKPQPLFDSGAIKHIVRADGWKELESYASITDLSARTVAILKTTERSKLLTLSHGFRSKAAEAGHFFEDNIRKNQKATMCLLLHRLYSWLQVIIFL